MMRLQPEDLSGWSFQSWHDKRTDNELAARLSAFCFLLLHILPTEGHYCTSSTLQAERASHRWPHKASPLRSQNYPVIAVYDPLIIKLRAA